MTERTCIDCVRTNALGLRNWCLCLEWMSTQDTFRFTFDVELAIVGQSIEQDKRTEFSTHLIERWFSDALLAWIVRLSRSLLLLAGRCSRARWICLECRRHCFIDVDFDCSSAVSISSEASKSRRVTVVDKLEMRRFVELIPPPSMSPRKKPHRCLSERTTRTHIDAG